MTKSNIEKIGKTSLISVMLEKSLAKTKIGFNVKSCDNDCFSVDVGFMQWKKVKHVNVVPVPKSKQNEPDCIAAK